MRFDTLLIANRGEIALRILATARQMGLRTVAVYSDADQGAPHVRAADLAVHLGPAEAGQSYRNTAAILRACALSGAQAVHPGYGFLSENAEFAQAVTDAGLVFVGPSAAVIALMGNKAQAKAAMQAAGVPTVPGAQGCRSLAEVLAAAERIGYPLILKAAAGGGGRGMRIVRAPEQLPDLYRQAQSEALGAFGSDEIILERAIERARHTEIQVLCDAHGHAVHLGERDCSTQRRFQKIIEEAPSPAVDAALRDAMGAVAVKACAAIGYTGVGTLEFLLGEDGQFYFMEMNTRLQVEHGVTELVTGLDLVEQQLRVAQGEALAMAQQDIRWHGHAMELRLCAEDPAAGFVPQVGAVGQWQAAPGLRVETALESGAQVSPHYDSMVAKLLAWAPDRAQCLQKLRMACERTVLLGLRSNQGFLARCLLHPRLLQGQMHTAFLAQEDLQSPHWQITPSAHALVAAGLLLSGMARAGQAGPAPGLQTPAAVLLTQASGQGAAQLRSDDAQARRMQLVPTPEGALLVTLARPLLKTQLPAPAKIDVKTDIQTDLQTADAVPAAPHRVSAWHCGTERLALAVDGIYRQLAFWQPDADSVWVQDGAAAWHYQRITRFAAAADAAVGEQQVRVPMIGRVVQLAVAVGDAVSAGQTLLVVESMKMEMPVLARSAGVVGKILVQAGAQLALGQVVMEMTTA